MNYLEKQDEWIKSNVLKVGDKVLVKSKAESYKQGWDNCWLSCMDDAVGKIHSITRFNGGSGIGLDFSVYNFPYFVLESAERGIFAITKFITPVSASDCTISSFSVSSSLPNLSFGNHTLRCINSKELKVLNKRLSKLRPDTPEIAYPCADISVRYEYLGKSTICVLFSYKEVYGVGLSTCSDKDTYDRELGEIIAFGRAIC